MHGRPMVAIQELARHSWLLARCLERQREETETDAFFFVYVGFIDGFIMIYPDFDGWRALYTMYEGVASQRPITLFVNGPVQRYRDRAMGYERVLPLSIIPMHETEINFPGHFHSGKAFKDRRSVVHEDLGALIETGDSAFCHSSCFRRCQKMLGQIVFHFVSA